MGGRRAAGRTILTVPRCIVGLVSCVDMVEKKCPLRGSRKYASNSNKKPPK